ncbi:NAD(P)/FAD-dependent oxidoreductase [Brevibacterium samyangense]|uniref:NAD(P)/FAD-dependent oxidoreductase n=1 Tax=Brevibacterium samyangense TaxID=366888 RepID=A0ABN2TDU1_9MICO
MTADTSFRLRVAVIGAGPSGLAQLRAFAAARKEGAEIPEIVCFERQSDLGGQWNYSWRHGTDEYGESVHSSMYRHLWSNGPKETLELADYTFDEHFGRPISSYPPREVLWDYISGRIERDGLREWIRFSTIVRRVDHDAATRTFTVVSEYLPTGEQTTEVFDRVVVATGHFSVPNVPYFEGIETFPGQVTHAHDFRGAEHMEGRTVLVVGGSSSAEDIALQAFKFGAARVLISHRRDPLGYGWPDRIEECAVAERFEGRTVHLADGTSVEVDEVVLCTGYRHSFPFLPAHLALHTKNKLWQDHLYKGVVFEHCTDLFYLGMQDQWFTFNMFDAMGWFVRDVILGRFELPPLEEMRADMAAWKAKFEAIDSVPAKGWFQAAHFKDVLAATDYPPFDVDAGVRTFLEWKQDKKEDILTYRDVCYTSHLTGTTATPHHTPWIDELDDSMENYLRLHGPVAAVEPAAGWAFGFLRSLLVLLLPVPAPPLERYP